MLFLKPDLLSQVLAIASNNLLRVIFGMFEQGALIRPINPLTSVLRCFIVSQVYVLWLFFYVHLTEGAARASRNDASLRAVLLTNRPTAEVMVDRMVNILQPGCFSVD